MKKIPVTLAFSVLCALIGLSLSACQKAGSPRSEKAGAAKGTISVNIVKSPFGTLPDGSPVEIYTLTNKNGFKARIMTYGATLVSLESARPQRRLGRLRPGIRYRSTAT